MRTVGMIEVTGCDLATFVRAAYSPSQQQGLGHFDPRGQHELTDEMVEEVLERGRNDRMCAIGLDYLNGRSIKMHVRKHGERLFINNRWYDHTDADLADLLEQIGLSADRIAKARAEEEKHRVEVKEKALQYLKDIGGEIKDGHHDDKERLPWDIREGLFAARLDNLVTEEYADGVSTWRLTQPNDDYLDASEGTEPS